MRRIGLQFRQNGERDVAVLGGLDNGGLHALLRLVAVGWPRLRWVAWPLQPWLEDNPYHERFPVPVDLQQGGL